MKHSSPLGPIKPSSPSTKELHDYVNATRRPILTRHDTKNDGHKTSHGVASINERDDFQ